MIKREFCDFKIEDGCRPSPSEIIRSIISVRYDDPDPEIDPYVSLHENFLNKFAAYIEDYYGD